MATRINNHSSPVRNAQPAPSSPSSSKKVGFLTALFYFFFGWLFAPKKNMDDLSKQASREAPSAASETTDKTSRVATGRSINKKVALRGGKEESRTGSRKAQQAAVPSTAQKSTSTTPSPTGSPRAQPSVAPTTAQKSTSTTPSPTGSPKTQQASATKTELTQAQKELRGDLEKLGFAAEALIENCKKNLNESELTKLHHAIKGMEDKNKLLNSSKWNNVIQVAWSAYKDLYEKLKQKNQQLAELSAIVASFSTAESFTPEKIAKGFELLAALKKFGKDSFTQVQIEKINECSRKLKILKTEIQKQVAQVQAIVDGIDEVDGATPEKIARGIALTTALKKFAKVLSKDENEKVINFELLFSAKISQTQDERFFLMENYNKTLKEAQSYLNNKTVLDEISAYAQDKPEYNKSVAQIKSAKENDPSTLFAGDLKAKRMKVVMHPDKHPDRKEEAAKLFSVVNAAAQALSN